MNDLGISVSDNVKSKDVFGSGGEKLENQLKGTGGTLHVIDKEQLAGIANIAWDLSVSSQKPVIVVVRAPRKV